MSTGDFIFAMLSETEKKLPFYLVGAGFDFHQELDPHERPEGYPHYQWIQVVKGSGEVNINGETLLVGENQGILIFPDVPHEYHAIDFPWIVNWFTFNGYHIEEFLNYIHIDRSGVYSVVQSEIFTSKIRKSLDLLRSSSPMKGLEASAIVYEFLISFLKYAHIDGEGDTVSSLHSRLNPVFIYIDKNYEKTISIEDLSEIISVTPQYLCILFKKIIKQRPIEYLNNVRINKSKDLLLKNPNMKIEEVSLSSGYESSSYYCSIFRKIEGISPGKFRELHLHQKYLHPAT
ncbi:MAG: AraC family ligand binding domain-containing protein [Spirochaetaceae bacterium]|nr:AraC family ligand binding domain-containing protein [Spirochaetaceae bacterium]